MREGGTGGVRDGGTEGVIEGQVSGCWLATGQLGIGCYLGTSALSGYCSKVN